MAAKRKSSRKSSRNSAGGAKAASGPQEGDGEVLLDRDALADMPKVEIHRHLEGSLPPEFFLEIAKEFPIEFPLGRGAPAGDVDGLRNAVTMEGQEPDFSAFLSKFETLRTFYVSPEVIQRATREAIRLAAEDNIRYLELRYNPIHFATQMAFDIEQVIEWVTEARDEAGGEFAIQVELIATVNRDDKVQESLPVIEAAVDGAGSNFVGVDIAGDENHGSLVRFAGVLRKAKAAGLGITIHAGEVGPATNVRDAIRLLGAHRIGHGIRAVDDPEVVKLAKDSGTIFEVCPTSNLRTGAVKSIEEHPLTRMAEEGLMIALCTDDPVIFGTTLTDEYALVAKAFGVDRNDFLKLNLDALKGAFRPREDRVALAQMFEDEFTSA